MNKETKAVMLRTFGAMQVFQKGWENEEVLLELEKMKGSLESAFKTLVNLEIYVEVKEMVAVIAAIELLIKYWGSDVLEMTQCDTIMVHELGIYSPWQFDLEEEVF